MTNISDNTSIMVILGYVDSLNFLILLKEKETVGEKKQEHKDNRDSLADEAKKEVNVKAEEEAKAKAKAEGEAKAKAEGEAKAKAEGEAKVRAEEEAKKEVVKEKRKKHFWEFWK